MYPVTVLYKWRWSRYAFHQRLVCSLIAITLMHLFFCGCLQHFVQQFLAIHFTCASSGTGMFVFIERKTQNCCELALVHLKFSCSSVKVQLCCTSRTLQIGDRKFRCRKFSYRPLSVQLKCTSSTFKKFSEKFST